MSHTMGRSKRRRPYVLKDSPPSSYAMASALEGEPGGLGRVLVGTLLRGLLLVPGIRLAGVGGEQAYKAAFLSSAALTGSIWALYTLRRGGYIPSWRELRPRRVSP